MSLKMFLYEWLAKFKNTTERRTIINGLIKYRYMSLYDTCEVNMFDSIHDTLFTETDIFETNARPVRDNTDMESIRRDLEEVGYCRLRGLSGGEMTSDREAIYRQMVADFASAIGVDPSDENMKIQSNQLIDNYRRAGIVNYGYRMFHSKSMWMVRGHPELVETMARIYECPPENLCVSFDTLGIRYAPEFIEHCITEMECVNLSDQKQFLKYIGIDELMPHVDQRFEYEFHENYQGIYAFTSTPTEDDGGILLYPSTHHLHGRGLQDVFETNPKQEFIAYPQLFHDMFPGSKPVHIPMTEGEYVIWDSRLVHSNACINPYRYAFERITWDICAKSTMFDWWRLHRIVGYICYHPDNAYSRAPSTMKGIKQNMANIYRKGWDATSIKKLDNP